MYKVKNFLARPVYMQIRELLVLFLTLFHCMPLCVLPVWLIRVFWPAVYICTFMGW